MRKIIISPREENQRLDKYLAKYLRNSGTGFLYKMLRKKNITLNGKKCQGNEKLTAGDVICLFMTDETLEKFGAPAVSTDQSAYKPQNKDRSLIASCKKAYDSIGQLPILYEDEDILAVSKPAGVLSQKAVPSDISLNEWLIGYLFISGALTEEEFSTFHPSVCNRLDRNTSGIVVCGKSLKGLQLLSDCLKNHKVNKFYRLFVSGEVKDDFLLEGYLKKDKKTNQVQVSAASAEGASYVKTGFSPLRIIRSSDGLTVTYGEAQLFTGKTHQIRAHLASVGHPLLGDEKYGNKALNQKCRKLGVTHQLLHAYRLEFPEDILNGLIITAEEPDIFKAFTK